MADNVTITAGSGTIVATDELVFNGTTAQFQMTKPGWGALDSFNPITAGAGGLPVVSQSQGNVASAAADSGNPVKIGGVFLATPPTVTTGQRVDAQCTANGDLKVSLSNNGVALFTSGGNAGDGFSGPSSNAYNTLNTVGYNRVFNPSGSWDKLRGDTTGAYSVPVPSINTGVPSTTLLIAGATINATTAKATPTSLSYIIVHNTSASTKFLKLYNKAASVPAPATDTPIMIVPIPASVTLNIPFGSAVRFAIGLGFVITGASAITDTTAVAAGDVILSLGFA